MNILLILSVLRFKREARARGVVALDIKAFVKTTVKAIPYEITL